MNKGCTWNEVTSSIRRYETSTYRPLKIHEYILPHLLHLLQASLIHRYLLQTIETLRYYPAQLMSDYLLFPSFPTLKGFLKHQHVSYATKRSN